MVQLMSKFTITLVSSYRPPHISKRTHELSGSTQGVNMSSRMHVKYLCTPRVLEQSTQAIILVLASKHGKYLQVNHITFTEQRPQISPQIVN